jgi:hypothetical protein
MRHCTLLQIILVAGGVYDKIISKNRVEVKHETRIIPLFSIKSKNTNWKKILTFKILTF